MAKIFRNIRQNSLLSNRFSKYLFYAIGEIILVVIGILVAVQINNLNESRKQAKVLKSILKNVSYDLVTDTTIAGNYIKTEEEVIIHSNRILNKEINLSNFKECRPCASIVTTYRPLYINTKGYTQLKNLIDENSAQKDSLIIDIVQFYDIFSGLINDSNTMLKNEALKNVSDFQQYDWFVDWTQGKYNEEMIAYFAGSEDYRKRVAAYNLLAEGNHLARLKLYHQNASEILKSIDKRIKKE
ncbi:DUF6090 family protein [Aquimarina sp. 2201CG5-10]|uniref:DUF6090 family protein n=1 Tax=Aquimarina callyspongiae TaxID=3098150 RepID=UPI002AB52E54|nr:DUF6090 family protein [Aquimarina sp. 2201CG5-10]MDY8138568.1 DUF6090 family protein [Aquimarina sp. 2201CG5-10]